jgi:serine/threonine protein kinase/tetratricopeptide (TPR) repeat protein
VNRDAPDDELLIELTGAVADGEEIDWESVEAAADDPAMRERVRHLRLIEQVVRSHGALRSAEANEGAPDVSAGSRVGHYDIVGPIGRGGMGAVYRAMDVVLEREVALKTPLIRGEQEPAWRHRFLREARSASRLSHPGIVTVFEAFEHDGRPWIAMELVEGETLREMVARGERFELEVLLRHFENLAEALAAAHEAGVLHRDIKPSNVLVGTDGRARLTDFGLARHLVEARPAPADASTASISLTDGGAIVGTPAYMAPESLLGREVDRRSDVYSLGALFYELCTGRRVAPSAIPAEIFDAVLHRDPEPITALAPELPADLDRIVRTCLRKDPERRYQDAAGLRDELIGLRRRLEEDAIRAAGRDQRRRRSLRRSVFMLASATSVAALLGFLALLQHPPPPGQRASVAVLPLVDATGESDGTLRAMMVADLVAVNLESSRLLRPIGPHRVASILGIDAQPVSRPVLVPRLASVASVDYVATGTLYKQDGVYLAVLETDPIGGVPPIPTLKEAASTPSELAERLARQLRRGLPGESLLLVWRDIAPGLAEVTSPSERALIAYEEGRLAHSQGRLGEALECFEEAVRIDPEFCRGHIALASTLAEAGYGRRRREAATRALELAPPEDAPETRQLALLAHVTHARAFGRWDEAVDNARRIVELIPDEPGARIALAGSLAEAGRIGEAIEAAARAVEMEPDNPRHRLARAGLLVRREGRADEALDDVRIAMRVFAGMDSEEGVAASAQVLGDALFQLRELDAAIDAFDEARRGYEAAGREVLAAKAQLSAARVLNVQGHPAAAAERFAGAAELARDVGSLGTFARARTMQGLAGFAADDYGPAETALREAIDVARRVDSDQLLWTPLFNLGSMLAFVGRLDEADHLVEESAAAARRLGNPEWLTAGRLVGADIAYQRGNLPAALQSYRALIDDHGDSPPTEDTGMAHLGLGEIFARQGRLDEALEEVERGIREFEALSLPVYAGYGRVERGKILARLGRLEEAREELAVVGELVRGQDVLADLAGRARVARAVVALHDGRAEEALEAARAAIATASLIPAVEAAALKAASESAAALGRYTEAVELAARGVSIGRTPPAERTRARVALAEALRGAGEAGRAREVAAQALEEAERMGLESAARRAEAVLAALSRRHARGGASRGGDTGRIDDEDEVLGRAVAVGAPALARRGLLPLGVPLPGGGGRP